jgi:glycosyltransferase involved in cell wall biosynthesis
MIKVLNVVIDNHIGGIQNRILCVGKELKNQGVQPINLSPNSGGDFSNIAQNSGFKVYQASIESPKLFNSFRNLLKNILWILKFPMGVIETIRIIKREDVDIVHVNGLLALHAVFAAKITKTPLIWHLIGTIYPQLLVRSVRPLFLWSEKIILVTNKTKKYYLGEDFTEDTVKVIFEPVDVNYFQKPQTSRDMIAYLRSKYNIPLESCVVGFIGNISPVKGLEYFLEVVRHQKGRSGTRAFFVIAGKVPKNHIRYLNKLRSLIDKYDLKNDVAILYDFGDVREIYSVLDIFLMTSLSEGTPLVILEAMAMEIPVVAPDVGGISEQISDGETGFVVPPRDIEATLKSLQVLLNDPDLRGKMGRMGRERVNSLFSLEKCIQSHRDLYSEMVEHGK